MSERDHLILRMTQAFVFAHAVGIVSRAPTLEAARQELAAWQQTVEEAMDHVVTATLARLSQPDLHALIDAVQQACTPTP